ncbi:MAG: TfoX/Sxy family protein [Pseudobdellovibrionaceae bacterium]
MSYDDKLFLRISGLLKSTKGVEPKKMFGGICFMHRGNMLCGIDGRRLMVRVGPNQYEAVLKMKHAKVMDITGKPMKGFIFVDENGYKTEKALNEWLNLGLSFTATLPSKKTKKNKTTRRRTR